MGELFSLKDEKRHAYRRRIVSHIYSMTSIVRSEGYMNLCVEEFMKVLDENAERRAVMDLGEDLQRYAPGP
jgi:ABC-type branched-subunit amino acid transport system ATPase component